MRPGLCLEGRYRILDLLGRGGMGAVYRAHDLGSGRDVAIKVLHSQDRRRLERFRREGQATAALTHPGIVRVHAAGEAEGLAYLVYELVPGPRSFERALEGLALRRRVELVRDAARALGFAHAHGLVHRDVKPDNVLVDAEGRVRVIDFGLARAADLERLTQTGAVVGTPHYLAPELLEGSGAEPRPASDVWALGVMLYQALCGELPFEARTVVELAAQIAQGHYRPVREVAPAVPRELAGVVAEALARDPARRIPDGEALALALDAWLGDRPRRGRSRLAPAALALGLLALGAAVGLAWARPWAPRPASPPVAAARPSPEPSLAIPPSPPPDDPLRPGEELRRAAMLAEGARLPALEGWLEAHPQDPRRERVEAERAWLRGGQPARTLEHAAWDGSSHCQVAAMFSPDGSRLLVSGQRKAALWRREAGDAAWRATGRVWEGLAGGDRPCGVMLPGGEALLASRQGLERLRLDTGGAASTPAPTAGEARGLVPLNTRAWGTALAWASTLGVALVRVSPDGLDELRRIELRGAELSAFAASPDGRHLACAWRRSGNTLLLRVFSLTQEAPVTEWELPFIVDTMAVSPDGAWLACGGRGGLLFVWRWLDPAATPTHISGPLDGALTEALGRAPAHTTSLEDVAWTPDGRLLYSASAEDVRVWAAPEWRLVRIIRAPAPPDSLAISPDGTLVAVGTSAGQVLLYPVTPPERPTPPLEEVARR